MNLLTFIPESIGNATIYEIMSNPKTDFTKRGNKIFLRNRSEQGVITIEFFPYSTDKKHDDPLGVSRFEPGSDPADEILELKSKGMLQKDIAFEMGISESYVSYILKKYKKSKKNSEPT